MQNGVPLSDGPGHAARSACALLSPDAEAEELKEGIPGMQDWPALNGEAGPFIIAGRCPQLPLHSVND